MNRTTLLKLSLWKIQQVRIRTSVLILRTRDFNKISQPISVYAILVQRQTIKYKIMSEASVTFSIKVILINFSFISRQTLLDIKLIGRTPEPETPIFFNNTCFPFQFLIVTSWSEPVTKNTCIYLQGFLCPRPVQRPPSFPLGEAWDYKERKIKK